MMLNVELREPLILNQSQCTNESFSYTTLKDMEKTQFHTQVKSAQLYETTYVQREVSLKINTGIEGTERGKARKRR